MEGMGVGGGGECGLSKEMGLGGEERLYIWALWTWWALWAMFGLHFRPICNCANFGPIMLEHAGCAYPRSQMLRLGLGLRVFT